MKRQYIWILAALITLTGGAYGVSRFTSMVIQSSTIDSTAIGNSIPAIGNFTVAHETTSLSPVPTQGAWSMWNFTAGGGETDFVNQRGNGAGGFNFYNATNAGVIGPAIATLNAAGNFAAIGTGNFGGAVTAPSFAGSLSGATVFATTGLYGTGSFNVPRGNITQIGWNQTGAGESDFFNQSGTGGGGFNWYQIPGNTTSGSPGAPIMTMDGSGNLGVTGKITAPYGFYGNLSGNASTASTASQLANTPGSCGAGSYISSLTANGTKTCTPTGIESFSVGGCTTASGSYSECSVNASLPTAYADANYQVSCSPTGAGSGYVSYTGVSSKSASGFVVGIATSGGQGATVSGFDCVAHHN